MNKLAAKSVTFGLILDVLFEGTTNILALLIRYVLKEHREKDASQTPNVTGEAIWFLKNHLGRYPALCPNIVRALLCGAA